MNLIVAIDSPRRGEVDFILHVGDRRALPAGFLHHCRRAGLLRRLLTLREALHGSFPGAGTHCLSHCFTYRPLPDEDGIARQRQVEPGKTNFYLGHDLTEPFALLRQAGFRLVGAAGWEEQACPAWQYEEWRQGGGDDTFPVIYPIHSGSSPCRCWLGTARDWPEAARSCACGNTTTNPTER